MQSKRTWVTGNQRDIIIRCYFKLEDFTARITRVGLSHIKVTDSAPPLVLHRNLSKIDGKIRVEDIISESRLAYGRSENHLIGLKYINYIDLIHESSYLVGQCMTLGPHERTGRAEKHSTRTKFDTTHRGN
jgi:hypothetical protein